MTTAVRTITHPVYDRVKADMDAKSWTLGYLTTAETARLVRERLKREFPGVKFSVRSHEYAGGSSVHVRWPMDGPECAAVDAVAQGFAFANFDGMIDMQITVTRWLCPDGSLAFARTHGTQGSGGWIPACAAAAPCPGAVRVGGGADYISSQRDWR